MSKYTEIEKIACPHCGYMQLDFEDYNSITSFWGEEESTEYECQKCCKTFYVEEYVKRHWIVHKENDNE